MPARLLSLLLAALLLLGAGSACAAEHTISGLFSITYDETVFTLDHSSYCDDSTPEHRWLFVLCSEDALIDVDMQPAGDYAVQSLDGADEAALKIYIDEMSFVGCEYIETVDAGEIPFGLFRMNDENGPYLLAETIANGWCIDFYAYYDQDAPVDEALVQALRSVVRTYRPMR